MSRRTVIGIALGNTLSSVGIFEDEQVKIIRNDLKNYRTPSVVAFAESDILVGEDALDRASIDPAEIVCDTKRLLGANFSHPSVQKDIQRWPFQVINVDGKPQYSLRNKGRQFSPEEISSMILAKMKDTAAEHLHSTNLEAVITVPGFFGLLEKQATREAGMKAGFKDVHLMDESTAAAMAYAFYNKITKKEENVLVYKLGGGTFEASVVSVTMDGRIEVKSKVGDRHLGGQDFTQKLVDHLANEYEMKHRKNIRENDRTMRRLRAACETAKQTLSYREQAVIDLEYLHDGAPFNTVVNRAHFEKICGDLFKETIRLVGKALHYAEMDKSEIQKVLLIGGSAKIPKLEELLTNFFDGKHLFGDIHWTKAVVHGAALQAAKLHGDTNGNLSQLKLQEVVPISLGIEFAGTGMMTIINMNTKLPTRHTVELTNIYDNQTMMPFKIYEGEYPDTEDNNFLGEFKLDGILPAPIGMEEIELTFEINASGILHVTARCSSNRKQASWNIQEKDKPRDKECRVEKKVVFANSPGSNAFGAVFDRYEEEKNRLMVQAENLLKEQVEKAKNSKFEEVEETVKKMLKSAADECLRGELDKVRSARIEKTDAKLNAELVKNLEDETKKAELSERIRQEHNRRLADMKITIERTAHVQHRRERIREIEEIFERTQRR